MARTPNRIQIPFVVDTLIEFTDEAGTKHRKVPVVVENAKVTVYNRESETPAAVYTSEKGESLLSPIETNGKGEIPGWVEEGAYRITVKEGSPSIAEKSLFWDATSGRGVEKISEYSGTVESGPSKTVKERELEEKVVNALVPVGSLFAFAGDTAPTGYLICDGSEFENKNHKKLSETLGNKYGAAAKGSEWTKLPNLKGKHPVGKDTGREAIKGSQPNLVGESGGSSEVALTEAQLAKHNHGGATGSAATGTESALHTHGVNDPGHAHGVNDPSHIHFGSAGGGVVAHASFGTGVGFTNGNEQMIVNNATQASVTGISIQGAGTGISNQTNNVAHTHTAGPLSIANAGSGTAHENMSPYVVTNYIIKAD